MDFSLLSCLKYKATSGSGVAERWPHHSEVGGLNPGSTGSTGRERKKCFMYKVREELYNFKVFIMECIITRGVV